MRIRRFNESKSNNISKEYLKDLFQSFVDDSWDIIIDDKILINDLNYYDDINSILDDETVASVKQAFWILLDRDFDDNQIEINSVDMYSEATDFYSELKSKLQILEQDGVSFYLDSMKPSRISIGINSGVVLIDVNKLEKLSKLTENGCILGFLLGDNKISVKSSIGNNTNFSTLSNQRIYGTHKNVKLNKSFEKWFDSNFRIEQGVDEYENIITIL